MLETLKNSQSVLISVGTLLAVIGIGIIIYYVIRFLLNRWQARLAFDINGTKLNIGLLRGPLILLIPGFCVLLTLPVLMPTVSTLAMLRHIIVIWLIISFGWFSVRLVAVVKTAILSQYNLDVKDNLKARRISTQLDVIQRVFSFVITLIVIASILMTFDKVRQVGISILASAGIAGIIIGFAAQKSLANLIAGIQIAITQPIRIDDVVIVEHEWGWIEEITLTYVVVKIWDQRRLIVPITFFIEKPFQSWTRTTAELLGTVFIYTDYCIPIDKIRAELQRIVESTPLWDKRVAKIQVTNTSDKTIELRALMSAENSPNAWELRCLVREKLIAFLQENYPDSLPRVRLEMNRSDHT